MADLVKIHCTASDLQRFGIGGIGNFNRRFQQAEQAFDIRQRLANFAVNKSEKPQGHEQLNHIGVDHHQLTQGHGTGGYLISSHKHHQRDRPGDNQRLPGVQRRQ